MREIEFRAKCSYGHEEWVYGQLSRKWDNWFITDSEGNATLIDVKTVGQSTGVKNIREGDIVTVRTRYGMDKGVVVYKHSAFMVYWDSKINFPNNGHVQAHYYLKGNKVLGNIHENPELLGDSK